MTNTLEKANTLTIGVYMHPWAKSFAVYAQRMIKEITETDSLIAYYQQKQELTQALLNGSVQVVCSALRDLPTKLPEGIVIGALSEREVVSNNLVISSQGADNTQLFSLRQGATVWAGSEINKIQLLAFRPDLTIEIAEISPIEVLKKTQQGTYQACLFTASVLNVLDINKEDYTIISFNPKEFITEAGQGVAAYLVAEHDLTTRRLLKLLHHPSVSQVTNVERKVKKLFNDTNIAVYCENDAMGNFHVWAAANIDNTLKTIRLSQSTNFDLAENCKKMLLS